MKNKNHLLYQARMMLHAALIADAKAQKFIKQMPAIMFQGEHAQDDYERDMMELAIMNYTDYLPDEYYKIWSKLNQHERKSLDAFVDATIKMYEILG